MNILYIGAFRLPCHDAAAARVLTIGQALSEAGHHVEYLSWGGAYDKGDYKPEDGYYTHGMKYTITGDLNSSTLFHRIRSKLLRGKRSLRELRRRNPDVIIAYNTPYKFNRELIKYAEERNIKLVADITEWYDDNELHFFDKKWNDRNMREMYLKFSNKIVISQFLDRFYKTSHNIVIPALCNKTDAKWNVTAPDSSQNTFNLIYAGNPAQKDDVHTVINVINKLCNDGYKLQFRIVGISKEDYLKRYKHLLSTETLSDSIRFEGRVSQDDVPQYYASSDFMILIRQDNRKSNAGFPTKFAESMMSGTPVITNSTSDLSLYIKNEVNGVLVNSSKFEDIEHSILHIIRNYTPEKISAMKCMAKKTGDKYFDYHAYISQLKDFFDNLA